MKDDNKKKTMMFTIIAIAALLVAVVGATFAYFSANQSGNGSVSARAATSRRDLIVVSGTSGALAITTDNELMAQPNANNNTPKYTATTESNQSGKITISITAGTGVAECKYNLVYKASDANHVFPGTTVSGSLAPKEFTITGVGKVDGVTNNTIAETSLSTCDNTTGCVLNGNTKLTSSGGTTETTEIWDFTINFYNLTADQSALENRSFGGVVTVEDLECYNNSVSNTDPENVRTTEQSGGGAQEQGQAEASIEIISGNLNTVGSEVAIGTEHFYVIGDDEETSGNVKLLSKYNLLVGEDTFGIEWETDAETVEKCLEMGGTVENLHDDPDYSDYAVDNYCSIPISPSTPGYNLQSENAVGRYCTVFNSKKSNIIYQNIDKNDCTAAGGKSSVSSGSGKCNFAVSSYEDIKEHTVITEFGNPYYNVSCDKSNGLFLMKSGVQPIDGLYKHEEGIASSKYDNGVFYWFESLNQLKSGYALQSGQIKPYVYYDHNKNTDSDNLVAPYVNNYVSIMQNLYNITISDARLISSEELVSLGCINGSTAFNCTDLPVWIKNTTFWSGSAYETYSSNRITGNGWMHFDGSYLKHNDMIVSYQDGVRPVISVSKSIFS